MAKAKGKPKALSKLARAYQAGLAGALTLNRYPEPGQPNPYSSKEGIGSPDPAPSGKDGKDGGKDRKDLQQRRQRWQRFGKDGKDPPQRWQRSAAKMARICSKGAKDAVAKTARICGKDGKDLRQGA